MTSTHLVFDKNKFYFYINALLPASMLHPLTSCALTMRCLLHVELKGTQFRAYKVLSLGRKQDSQLKLNINNSKDQST